MVTYKNLWHKENNPYSGPPSYTTNVTPVEYKGYLIYERIPYNVWDIVKDDACISQRAGPRGARDFIDSL